MCRQGLPHVVAECRPTAPAVAAAVLDVEQGPADVDAVAAVVPPPHRQDQHLTAMAAVEQLLPDLLPARVFAADRLRARRAHRLAVPHRRDGFLTPRPQPRSRDDRSSTLGRVARCRVCGLLTINPLMVLAPQRKMAGPATRSRRARDVGQQPPPRPAWRPGEPKLRAGLHAGDAPVGKSRAASLRNCRRVRAPQRSGASVGDVGVR